MTIKILGPGCPKCQILKANAKKAVEELDFKDVKVEHIYDINKMIEMGMMFSPGLVINDKLVSQGRIPEVEEIKKWLKQ